MNLNISLLMAVFALLLLHVFVGFKVRWQTLELEATMRRVEMVLVVWAEHWGEPVEVVKPLLLQALEAGAHRSQQRRKYDITWLRPTS